MDGMTMDFKIQTLLRQEDGWWVLQCLEYDIAAYGKRISEAIESFKNTFTGQVILDVKNGKEPLSGIGRAPEKYWDEFNSDECYAFNGKQDLSFTGKTSLPPGMMIPPVEIIESRLCA